MNARRVVGKTRVARKTGAGGRSGPSVARINTNPNFSGNPANDSAIKGVFDYFRRPEVLRALKAALFIVPLVLCFWPYQLGFWTLGNGIFAIDHLPWVDLLNYLPFFNFLIPGDEMLILSIVVIFFVFGLISMIYAAFVLTINWVDWYSGGKLIIVALCLVGYFAPVTSFIPWTAIWVIALIFLQKK